MPTFQAPITLGMVRCSLNFLNPNFLHTCFDGWPINCKPCSIRICLGTPVLQNMSTMASTTVSASTTSGNLLLKHMPVNTKQYTSLDLGNGPSVSITITSCGVLITRSGIKGAWTNSSFLILWHAAQSFHHCSTSLPMPGHGTIF